VLADFRAWLHEAATAAPPPVDAHGEPIDLHTLLGQFLALKHEVNLQTRAVRAQQEQNAETLRQLTQSLDLLRQTPTRQASAAPSDEDELLRPLLKTLVDMADALGLAQREVRRVSEALTPQLEQLAAAPAAAGAPARRSFWSRMFNDHAEQDARTRQRAGETAEQVRLLIESVLQGYTMSLQRVERALRQHGLEPIPAEGQPFDPEQMGVVEAVRDTGLPAGQVVQVVRPGYRWHGRVFRYAQVSVAKGG